MTFENPEYLAFGNAKQRRLYQIVSENSILTNLAQYNPVIIGTIPIGLDMEGSDADIGCYFTDASSFAEDLELHFSAFAGFRIYSDIMQGSNTVIATFHAGGFDFEIFGQDIPTTRQYGYRHMLIEYRIMEEKDDDFKQEILALKRSGLKTEPAFAAVLGIPGDPYMGLLEWAAIHLEP